MQRDNKALQGVIQLLSCTEGHVTIDVSVGTGELKTRAIQPHDHYSEEDVLIESAITTQDIYRTTESNISYLIGHSQYPKVGILQIAGLTERSILQEVKIINDAELQNRELIKKQYPNSLDVRHVLKTMPTDIQVKLRDLKTYDCLQHEIEIGVMTIWSAPKQINLSAAPNQ